MEKDLVWENKKLVRHSLDYYKWLLSVCEKRKIDKIWVAFTKTKFGQFDKNGIIRQIKERE